MKRGATPPAVPEPETTRRRRQPQISCNFCRSKKLKCDRAQPCFNCRSRGIECLGQTHDQSRDTPDVLDRLRRLEDAVFGHAPPASRPADAPADASTRPPAIHRDLDRSAELDYNPARSGDPPALDGWVKFSFRVAPPGSYSGPNSSSTRCVDLPSRDDAASLFHDYLDASDVQVAAMLHPPSFQATMSNVYSQLRQGHQVDISCAALILAICAATAFYWDQDLPFLFPFQSEDHAAAQSHAWRTAACDLLSQSQRCSSTGLETIQAQVIIADLIYNMEGTTSSFRYMHSCARAAAYELKLHMIDLPGQSLTDDTILREMKRRVWWYLVGTDWLFGTMGGAMDRIYTVNPKHMRVNRPQYISNSDRFTHGLWSEISVAHLNFRIRLADLCRQIADTLPLGSGDVDTLSYSTILALDREFESILAELPASDDAVATIDNSQCHRIAIQRAIGALSVHARRARFLRPLLEAKGLPPTFQVFRRTCFHSIEAVMAIASRLLSQAVDSTASTDLSGFSTLPERAATTHRSPRRRGLIINHLFMACAVLATDPSLRGDIDGASRPLDAETERRRAQIGNACRLLQKAGEKSAMASDVVKRLVSVLRRHHVQGLEVLASAATTVPRTEHDLQQNQPPPSQQKQHAPTADMEAMEPYAMGYTAGSKDVASVPTAWSYDVATGLNGLNGIWNEFLGTNPTNDGWGQLFADLDYLNYGI